MEIKDLMSRDIVAVKMDEALSRVKELFEETAFHHLLVLENGRLLGVISDRDLLKSLSPKIDTAAETTQDLASLNKKAHQIMTPKPISLNLNSNVREAVEIFNQNPISCIPIIDDDDKPVGILSWRDIMRELGEKNKT